MSVARPMTRDDLVPGAGSSSYSVHHGARAHVDDLAADAEILQRRFEQGGVLLQRVLRHGGDLLLRLGEKWQGRQLVGVGPAEYGSAARRTGGGIGFGAGTCTRVDGFGGGAPWRRPAGAAAREARPPRTRRSSSSCTASSVSSGRLELVRVLDHDVALRGDRLRGEVLLLGFLFELGFRLGQRRAGDRGGGAGRTGASAPHRLRTRRRRAVAARTTARGGQSLARSQRSGGRDRTAVSSSISARSASRRSRRASIRRRIAALRLIAACAKAPSEMIAQLGSSSRDFVAVERTARGARCLLVALRQGRACEAERRRDRQDRDRREAEPGQRRAGMTGQAADRPGRAEQGVAHDSAEPGEERPAVGRRQRARGGGGGQRSDAEEQPAHKGAIDARPAQAAQAPGGRRDEQRDGAEPENLDEEVGGDGTGRAEKVAHRRGGGVVPARIVHGPRGQRERRRGGSRDQHDPRRLDDPPPQKAPERVRGALERGIGTAKGMHRHIRDRQL